MINSTLPQLVNNRTQEILSLPSAEICALGHPLGDCPARRVGCNNHYQLLHLMYPPLSVLLYVRSTMSDDPAVRHWLDNLDAILPGGQG